MKNQECEIKIGFGTPEHGWLPMTFQWQEFQLELDLSDVPVDPMTQLLDALIQLSKGIQKPGEVLWHLEPECYYLQLEQVSGQYRVQVFNTSGFNSNKTLVKDFYGNYHQIILPLYRELKRFSSYAYTAPHWGETALSRIELLTELVHKNK